MVLYPSWIPVISAAFFAVRIDHLSCFFNSVLDAARGPLSGFLGTLRFVFPFVFPLAPMTSFPAMALLGKLDLTTAVLSVGGGLAFGILARLAWGPSIAHDTSSSS
ncbi:MAG: ABC-2 family transporter protein [Deltaproteobacteria bacterium]|nr:ABC-2 family transporter protein [Deltaproteobacteria bacterium]